VTSFDVTSLFTNVPVDFAINLILDFVFRRSYEFNGLNSRRTKKLLEWVVKTTTFQFNGRFYLEVDSVAMGSPIAPLMADVCVNYVIDQALAVTPPECRSDLLCRYVDDLFLLFPKEDSLNRFFTNVSSIHRNIFFTKELETNNCLHFLDVSTEKTSTGFITSTYRKPTHTGLYSKWSSFVPLHRKRNFANSLLRRAYDIASSYQLVHTEFMNIKRMLSRNGCPDNFWTVAFSNSSTENTLSRNNVMHRLNPLLHPNIFYYNYRIWVLYLITYDRN